MIIDGNSVLVFWSSSTQVRNQIRIPCKCREKNFQMMSATESTQDDCCNVLTLFYSFHRSHIGVHTALLISEPYIHSSIKSQPLTSRIKALDVFLTSNPRLSYHYTPSPSSSHNIRCRNPKQSSTWTTKPTRNLNLERSSLFFWKQETSTTNTHFENRMCLLRQHWTVRATSFSSILNAGLKIPLICLWPGVQKRTHVDIKGGQRPEWDGEVRFNIKKNTGAKFRKLEVSCYSQEPRSEDLMGQGVVDITETLKTGEFDGE